MASSSSYWESNVVVSKEEFELFHSIDRKLFSVLVLSLLRDRNESIAVIAFWLWLERRGFGHVVKRLLMLPTFLVNQFAEEAVTCLALISGVTWIAGPLEAKIPLTLSLVLEKDAKAGLVALLWAHNPAVVWEVLEIVTGVCARAMGDMLQASEGNGESPVPADERTMFVTFSKGYAVYEWEVRGFFTRYYGEICIESLHMQEVEETEQSLFARIVFKNKSTIDMIMKGMSKAKFTINGKHVWVRKFVPKRSAKPKSAKHCLHYSDDLMPTLPDSLFD